MQRVHKPGRNTACHCGSGIKYKRCHGRPPETLGRPTSDIVKASEALLEVAAPLLSPDLPDDVYLQRLQLALMGWNLAVLEAEAEDTLHLHDQAREAGIDDVVAAISTRKTTIFPNDFRHLFEVTLTPAHDGTRRIQVASVRPR